MSSEEPDALAYLRSLRQECAAKLQELEAYSLHCSEHLPWSQLSGDDRALIAACKQGGNNALLHLYNARV
jgi:hypothetical protein